MRLRPFILVTLEVLETVVAALSPMTFLLSREATEKLELVLPCFCISIFLLCLWQMYFLGARKAAIRICTKDHLYVAFLFFAVGVFLSLPLGRWNGGGSYRNSGLALATLAAVGILIGAAIVRLEKVVYSTEYEGEGK